jgi:cystathionine beta-synthase
MNKKILFGNINDDIKETIKTMKQHGISQLPILDHNHCVGIVSESILLDAIINSKGTKLKEIMEDAPPSISKDASIDIIANLLKFYPMILVSSAGKYLGIITKSDLLEKISNRK